jgi:hypothetical protein
MYLSRLLGVIVLVAAGTRPASADIFVWRDASGVSHYTNDLANVPPEYRTEAMTVAKDWARAEPPPAPAAMPVAATVGGDPSAVSPARDGYEAAYLAGLRAARLGGPPSSGSAASIGSVGSSAENQPQSGATGDRLAPNLIERYTTRRTKRDAGGEDDARNPVSAVPSFPFLQGPVGPPAIPDR